MIDQALLNLAPGCGFILVEDVIHTWITEDIPQPSQEEIDTEVARLQAEHDANQYQRDREYPAIEEQLDMLYWDKKNGTSNWEESIEAVKAAYPK